MIDYLRSKDGNLFRVFDGTSRPTKFFPPGGSYCFGSLVAAFKARAPVPFTTFLDNSFSEPHPTNS
jgi:hypothetical protein